MIAEAQMTVTSGRKQGACPCEGGTLERLIRPAVLILLTEGPQYGYRITRRLTEMPMFAGEKPNAAGVYRCLKLLAQEGSVTSEWALSESGPAKRLYIITPTGEQCLASWLMTLTQYREAVDALLALGQQAVDRWRAE